MIRAMTTQWSLLWILALVCSSDSSCSPTSYYKSCWIRRFPGLYVDTEESQRRGAHVLKVYQEETALKCSRACCLTPNFSCTLAVFHFNTTQDSVNCFHLQCPTLESCIPHHRGNVILYNVTKGVDPDLLVFGKYFTTNVRVLPHMSSSRLNVSEPLTSDKRHFNYPPNPPVRSTSAKTPTTPVPTTHQVQHTLPRCTTIPATTAQRTPSPTLNSQQTPQRASTNTAQMNKPETTADTLNQSIPNSSAVYTTRPNTSSDLPIKETPSSSTTQQHLGLHTSTLQTTTSLVTASQFFTKFLTSTQTTEQATSQSKPTSMKLQEHLQTSVPMTVSETYTSASSNVALETSTQITPGYQTAQATNAQSTSTKTDGSQQTTATLQGSSTKALTLAYTTIQVTTAQSTSEHVTTTTPRSKTDSTFNPQPTISTNIPLQTSTPITPDYKTSTWTPTKSTTPSQPKETTSSDTGTLRISTTTPRYLTHTRMGNTVTTGSLSSSLTAPTSSMVESQPYPNDTKGYISRNVTTDDAPQPSGDGSLTSVWHLAANTVLVALATCATIIFGCCCSVFVALSWRGRRRRKGRYRTNLRGKRGSMRLIKYVIVRESS